MPAENFFTQLAIPLARASKNYAPARPIQDAIRNKKLNKEPSRFEESFRKWHAAKLKYQKNSWDELISMSQLVSLFRRGNQLLQKRQYGPGYYVRPIQPTDGQPVQTAMNLMTFHSQVSESKLMAVNPTVNMRPGDDTPEAIASAQACRPTVDYFESQWYTAKFTRREAIRFLTDGMVIYQVRWNPFKGGMQVQERSVSRRDVTIDPGSGMCADCKYEGEADEFTPTDFGNQCPECQGEAVDIRPAVKDSMAQIGMGQPKSVGEPEIVASALANWRWDLSVDLELSSFAIKRQNITQGVVKLMLGDMTIPDSSSSDDYGLRVLDALTYSGQAFQGSAQSGYSDIDTRPTMSEAWLGPEDQAELECDEGETVCGVTMPKGRLSKTFKGVPICVVSLNDGALIIGTYADESQREEVVTAQWFMDADSGAGRGMEDTAGVQKRFNAVDGQIYKGLAATATPAVITDMRIVKEDQGEYLFQPGQNIDINLSMLPPNMKLADAFYLGNPGAVSQQYINYGTVFLKQMADLSSLAVEFSDLLSIDNRTATGAQISAALANSLYGPMLMSKGESRVEIAKKIVRLQAQFGVVSRYFPGKGNAKGREVSADNLKGKVIFELEENSHLPTTPYSQQSDVTNLLTAFGTPESLMGVRQGDPALFKALTRPYSFFRLDESGDDISTLCLSRLDQMKQLFFGAGVDDPTMLPQMIQPPVSLIEPKQKEKADWWADYLDLDSAQKLPAVLRTAIENMYWLHTNMDTQKQLPQAANAGLIQAAQAAPAAMGQAALEGQAEQVQPEVEDKSAEIAADLEIAHSKQKTDLELKKMEGETQETVAHIQGKNAAESARIAGQNQLKVEKAKPRPRPTKAA